MVEPFLLARLLGEAVATQHRGLFDLHAEMVALGSGQGSLDNPIDHGLPIFSFSLRRGGISASFFSTITTFGTPLDVTAQELAALARAIRGASSASPSTMMVMVSASVGPEFAVPPLSAQAMPVRSHPRGTTSLTV